MKTKTHLLLFFLLIPASPLYAQPRACPGDQRYIRSVERCVDKSAEDAIYLGVIDRESLNENERTALLQDDTKGQLTLLLTPPLIDTLHESPADSYEVEGYLIHGENGDSMAVRNLRPIE